MQTYRKVILIALDMLRADHVGCHGYPRPTTPNIDALAQKSTVFTDCTSAFCCTMPSFTSMLTGKLPRNHGVVINPWNAPNCHEVYLDDTTPTIAERLWSESFLTAAVDNLISFASHPNWFARGNQHYLNATRTAAPRAYMTRGDAINAEVLPWLRANHERDFFLFVHYWDPHGPFTQPEKYNAPFRQMELPLSQTRTGEDYVIGAGPLRAVEKLGRGPIDEYDGATRFVDECVGEMLSLLDDLGRDTDTVVIITSDHGRTDYGRRDHWRARGVYQGTMHVPLVIHVPAADQPASVDHPVHATDLVPTVLELLGRELPVELDGRSLVAAMRDGSNVHEMLGACGAYCGAPQRLLRRGNFKLIRTYSDAIADIGFLYDEEGNKAMTGVTPLEVYDLDSDPFEQVNLAGEWPELADQLDNELAGWLQRVADDPTAPDPLIENSRWGIQVDATLVN